MILADQHRLDASRAELNAKNGLSTINCFSGIVSIHVHLSGLDRKLLFQGSGWRNERRRGWREFRRRKGASHSILRAFQGGLSSFPPRRSAGAGSGAAFFQFDGARNGSVHLDVDGTAKGQSAQLDRLSVPGSRPARPSCTTFFSFEKSP
jgi:hypothetical protein